MRDSSNMLAADWQRRFEKALQKENNEIRKSNLRRAIELIKEMQHA